MSYKGSFKPAHPKKYRGDPNKITYRSLWERDVMRLFDSNPKVLEWSSEEVAIPYMHPIKGRQARYYPDFIVKIEGKRPKMIEVKPDKETRKPDSAKRKTKKHLNEIVTYAINDCKWIAAREVCLKNDMDFEIWTEHTLKAMGLLKATKVDKQLHKKEANRPKHKAINKPKRPRPTRKS